jgi:DNA-binding SARP family transcriptional activator
MGRIELFLAGVPQILKNGSELSLGRRKALAILAYLLWNRQGAQSEFLAELLWPENAKNRKNLRTTISYLNTLLNEAVVLRKGSSLRLNPAVDLRVDVKEMQQLAEEYTLKARSDRSAPAAIELLERLVLLHRGLFLSGFYLRGCPDFEHWVLSAQEEIEQLMEFALSRLVQAYRKQGEYDRAIAHARRWIDLDRANEPAHRALIELYGLAGQRQTAIRQYQTCVQTLKQELGVQPEEETVLLYQALLSGENTQIALMQPDAQNTKIAVLPLTNQSDDRAWDFLCNGFSDAIRAKLSRLHDLHVVSWASAARFKDSGKDVRTIGRELNARYIVDGSLERHGRKLRISVELIEAVQDRQLWARTFTGTEEDVLDIQERLSRSIAESILPKLSSEEEKRIADRPVRDVHAYEAYLRARPGIWSFEPCALREAERELLNALDIVGPNELLYATLARVYARIVEAGISTEENPVCQSEECIRKAFELNPASPSGYSVRGQMRFARGDFQEALWDLKQAFQSDPNDPETLMFLCYICMLAGKTAAAAPYLHKLLEVDPLTPINHCMPGFLRLMQGCTAEVSPTYEKFYRMDPANPLACLFFGWALALEGRTEEACSTLVLLSSNRPQDPYVQAARFMRSALQRRKRDAMEAAAPPLTTAARQVEFFSRFLVDCYALIDEKPEALDWLENDFRLGFCNYPYLVKFNPLIENLRTDMRFQRLMQRIREKWESFEV